MQLIHKFLIAVFVLTTTPLCAVAAPFPPPLIKVIVPFPPGGPTDVIGRYTAQVLAEKLKTNVIVENRAGASATIGSASVARSEPDGSTLLFNATHHVTNPAFFKKLPYDTRKDFTPIALVASVPSALVVHPGVKIRSLSDLIAEAKKAPKKFALATFGGANQLSAELFKSMAGIELHNIDYKGQAGALNDVIGGHVPMMFDSLPTVLPHIRSGKVFAVAVTSATRSPLLPEVPTIAEAGPMPGYETTSWFGLFMPAADGSDVANKLSMAMAEILANEEVKKRLRDLGADPGKLTGPAFRNFVDVELKKWVDVAERANIEKQ